MRSLTTISTTRRSAARSDGKPGRREHGSEVRDVRLYRRRSDGQAPPASCSAIPRLYVGVGDRRSARDTQSWSTSYIGRGAIDEGSWLWRCLSQVSIGRSLCFRGRGQPADLNRVEV